MLQWLIQQRLKNAGALWEVGTAEEVLTLHTTSPHQFQGHYWSSLEAAQLTDTIIGTLQVALDTPDSDLKG